MNKDFLTIGEIAKKMGVSVRTLQYYDKEGLLCPSAFSEGGRRLYSNKDIVKLHQILSFKHLGFSLEEIKTKLFLLDTPKEVLDVLHFQKGVIESQITTYQKALKTIMALEKEVAQMNKVNFSTYADIIEMIKSDNENYWAWKHFENPLKEHIRKRFGDDEKAGIRIFNTYKKVLEEALSLVEQDENPNSEKSQTLAKRWWNMIMDFTGGDMSLIPLLEKFNDDKGDWHNEYAEKQKKVDKFLESILRIYFEKQEG